MLNLVADVGLCTSVCVVPSLGNLGSMLQLQRFHSGKGALESCLASGVAFGHKNKAPVQVANGLGAGSLVAEILYHFDEVIRNGLKT